jgi:hypothetical protein
LATFVLAACADDDGDGDASSDATEATDASAEEFCDNFAAINRLASQQGGGEEGEGEPEPGATTTTSPEEAELEEQLQQAAENAPEELKADVEEVSKEVREPSEQVPPEAFFTSLTNIGDWAADNCGWQNVTLTAKEYEFTGMPEEVEAGTILVKFENQGAELHEAAFFSINEGVTESVEELLQLPEEEATSKVAETGAAYALPAGTYYTTVELEEGRHGIVCFVPQGLTLEALQSGQEPDGAPHFMEGMHTEFEVTAA